MVNVRFQGRSAVGLIVLVLASAFLTLHNIAAYNVSDHIYVGDDILDWTSAPSGSFLPWPRAAGMLEMLSRESETGSFIYT